MMFKKIASMIKKMDKINVIILYWYIVSTIIIVLEIITNVYLAENVYFHPYISLFIRALLPINIVLLPLFLTDRSIIKDDDHPLMKAFLIVVSNIGIVFIGLMIVLVISFFDKAVFGIDTLKMTVCKNRVYVQEMRAYDHETVKVYETEHLIFVKLLDN